jgi:hypothetical protein
LLSEDTLISVEVPAKSPTGEKEKEGKVDFYIDGNREWAVEFLICGDKPDTKERSYDTSAVEHLKRFEPSGQYESLKPRDYLLVDFRPKDSYQADLIMMNVGDITKVHHYWIVNYDADALYVTKIDQDGKCCSKNERIQFIR